MKYISIRCALACVGYMLPGVRIFACLSVESVCGALSTCLSHLYTHEHAHHERIIVGHLASRQSMLRPC